MASRVMPIMTEKELVDSFIYTLKAPYLEHLIANASSSFNEIVAAGD